MLDNTKIPLISSGIAELWNSYMTDSIIARILEHFVNRINNWFEQPLQAINHEKLVKI